MKNQLESVSTKTEFPKLMHNPANAGSVWLVLSVDEDSGEGKAMYITPTYVGYVFHLQMEGLVDFNGKVILSN